MVNLQEWHLQLQLMEQDERQRKERERKAARHARIVGWCLMGASAVVSIAAIGGVWAAFKEIV